VNDRVETYDEFQIIVEYVEYLMLKNIKDIIAKKKEQKT
jgi:hypothetical protein